MNRRTTVLSWIALTCCTAMFLFPPIYHPSRPAPAGIAYVEPAFVRYEFLFRSSGMIEYPRLMIQFALVLAAAFLLNRAFAPRLSATSLDDIP